MIVHYAAKVPYSGCVSLCGKNSRVDELNGRMIYNGAVRTRDWDKVNCPDCIKHKQEWDKEDDKPIR